MRVFLTVTLALLLTCSAALANEAVTEALKMSEKSSEYKYLTPPEASVEVSVEVKDEDNMTWNLEAGSFKSQLQEWSSKGGWQVVWNAKRDYSVYASAKFSGSLYDAVAVAVETLRDNGNPILADFYDANKVIVISEE